MDAINALMTAINGNIATIQTDIGLIRTDLDAINASITAIGDGMAVIQTDIGEIQVDVAAINASITTINGNIATIQTDIGAIEVDVDAINASITAIEDGMAVIQTDIGEIQVDVAAINASITAIEDNVATIQTDIGAIEVDVAAINASITTINGNIATIQTDMGTIQVDVDVINASITAIEDGMAVIQTDVETIKGKIVDVQARLATVATDVGTIKAMMQEWTGKTTSFTGAKGTSWDVLVLTTSQTLDNVGVSKDVLGMKVSGPDHSQGQSNIFIPKAMLAEIGTSVDRIAVTLDDKQMAFSFKEYPDTYGLSLAYTHSTHKVQVWFGGLPVAVKTVQPEVESKVETYDGKVSVHFPAGATSAETQVIVRETTTAAAPAAPAGFKFGATSFVIEEVKSLVVIDKLNPLSKEVTITVRYTQDDLDAAGGNPSLLTLCRYDEDPGEWVALPTTVDEAAMTLTATTDRFSRWIIMVPERGAAAGDDQPLISLWLWVIIGLGTPIAAVLLLILLVYGIMYQRRRAHRRGMMNSAHIRWG